MRKSLLLLIIVTGIGYSHPIPQSRPMTIMVQTITSDEIAQAGITRLADILLLADKWDVNSTDYFTWKAVAGGLGTLQQQHWDVFLDNHKMDARFFDTINLNLLGITLSQIDSVHIGSVPTLILGKATNNGFVHIFTSRQSVGWSLKGNVNMGNETGDPGPYLYTGFATPNVDRIGPSAEATLSHGSSNGQEVATLLVQQHPYTDIALAPRTLNFGIDWPGLYHVSPTLTVDRKLFGGWHQYRVAIGYATSLFNLSEGVGHEMPSDLFTTDMGVAGNIPQSEQLSWKYRLLYASHDMSEAPNSFGFQYSWDQKHIAGNLELVLNATTTNWIFGASVDGYQHANIDSIFKVDTGYSSTYSVTNAYTSVAGDLGPRANYSLSALATLSESNLYGNLIGSVRWQPYLNHSISFNGALNQYSPSIENTHRKWLWGMPNLYQWSGNIEGDRIVPPWEVLLTDQNTKQYSLDLNWDYSRDERMHLEAGLAYRKIDHLQLEDHFIDYDPISFFFPTQTKLAFDQSIQILGAHIGGSGKMTPQITWRSFYRIWRNYKSTIIASNEFQKLPRHKFSARINWLPHTNFSIWIAVTYSSQTYWAEYAEIDGSSYPVIGDPTHAYWAQVPSWLNIDLQLRKLLWHRRLAATVLLRNLLDQKVRYHPIGGTFHLTLFVMMKLALD